MEGSLSVNDEMHHSESLVRERCLFRLFGLIGSGKTMLLRRTHEVLNGRVPLALAVRPGKVSERDAHYLEGVGIKQRRILKETPEEELAEVFWKTSHERGAVFTEEREIVFGPRLRYEREIRIWIQPVLTSDTMPEKYPDFYEGIDLVIINQMDLLPFTDFSIERFRRSLKMAKPGVELLGVSCRSGVGLEIWRDWFLYRMGLPPLESNSFRNDSIS
jgi:hydrogenase nickel incorporation protein HypB